MEDKTPEEIIAEARAKAVEVAEAKAEVLSEKEGKKVTAIVLGDSGEFVGFIREPKLQAKKAAFDKIATESMADAGEVILTTSLITEESSPEFVLGRNDDVYLSACIACIKLVKVYHNASKKK